MIIRLHTVGSDSDIKCPEVKSGGEIGKDLRRNRYEDRMWMEVTVRKGLQGLVPLKLSKFRFLLPQCQIVVTEMRCVNSLGGKDKTNCSQFLNITLFY
jgi:hypothetical protein